MADKVKCPQCPSSTKTFTPQGLRGHLRFKHSTTESAGEKEKAKEGGGTRGTNTGGGGAGGAGERKPFFTFVDE